MKQRRAERSPEKKVRTPCTPTAVAYSGLREVAVATLVDFSFLWEWNVCGAPIASMERLCKSGRTAEARIRHTMAVNQRAFQKLRAYLQEIMGTRRTPAHLLLFTQPMIDQMIHHGLDMRVGNAVPRSPLFREIR
jgi:hypothetical protein